MKKKTLTVLLACVLALSVLPTWALAEGAATPVDNTTGAGFEASMLSFEDVAHDAWYYSAVQYAGKAGLMAGVSDNSFAPDEAMTRAMLVTVLYRLDGSNKTEKPVRFTDVAKSDWYCDAVEWAAASGIATGCGDSVFGADDNITRQEIAEMLKCYANYRGRNTDNTADLSAFADASAVADWARSAMGWAVSGGLFTGTDSRVLLPEVSATRAEAATILMRYTNGAALEKRNSDYASQFAKGNFNNFYEDCGDQLRQSITLDRLLKGWNTIIQITGAPGELLDSIHIKQSGGDAVVSSISGTLYNIAVTIHYDKDGKPSGIWTSYIPKNPPAPQSTDKWEEIAVKVGKMELPGMLTLPKGVQKPPVAILIQGSGASDMNEALGTAPNRPFEDLAHGLAEQGVATLRYNKSTYQYKAAGGDTIEYEVLDDAVAAVKMLCNDNRVDADRIYLLGHSLGGMMAPKITADNSEIKGFISMAGTLRSIQDISLDQNKAAIEAAASLTEQQKKELFAQVEAEVEKTKTLDDGGTGYIMGLPKNYWKSLNAIRSIDIVKGLNVPMLILQGGADFQIYPDKDYKLWQTTLEGRSNATFKLYDGLSHLFMPNQISANGAPDSSVYNAPNHVDLQVITDIAAWINKQ